jgi:hypothetical protein
VPALRTGLPPASRHTEIGGKPPAPGLGDSPSDSQTDHLAPQKGDPLQTSSHGGLRFSGRKHRETVESGPRGPATGGRRQPVGPKRSMRMVLAAAPASMATEVAASANRAEPQM